MKGPEPLLPRRYFSRMRRGGFLIAMLLSRAGLADSRAGQSARAEALFIEARQLMDAGNLEEACPAFATSLRLERAVGTLLNLARCYELQGKTASAWSLFIDAESYALTTHDLRRAELARANHQRLAAMLPRVTVTASGLDATTTLLLDDSPLDQGALGLPLPIDPGPHVLVARGPSTRRAEVHFIVPEGPDPSQEPLRIVIDLPPAPLDGPPPPTPSVSSTAEEGSRPAAGASEGETKQKVQLSSPGPTAHLSGAQWLATALAVSGLAGIGVGVGMGVAAMESAAAADCDENLECSDTGLEQRDRARELLEWGYAVGIAGGVVATAGIVTFAVAKNGQKRRVNLSTGIPGTTCFGVSLRTEF